MTFSKCAIEKHTVKIKQFQFLYILLSNISNFCFAHEFFFIFFFSCSLIMKTTGLFFFLAFINAAYGFKVLAFLPFFAQSHNKIGSSIARNLAEAGHDVTVLSCFPQKTPIKNYRDISTADFLESFFKGDKLILWKFT